MKYVGDFVIMKTHESKCGSRSNYTYSCDSIYESKEDADAAIKDSKYEWRGNSTGSVAFRTISRAEFVKEYKGR